MGRANRLKQGRRAAERTAARYPKPKAGKYAGASWWQKIVSIVWPAVLDKPRAKVQSQLDALHNQGVKIAIKKVAHQLARKG